MTKKKNARAVLKCSTEYGTEVQFDGKWITDCHAMALNEHAVLSDKACALHVAAGTKFKRTSRGVFTFENMRLAECEKIIKQTVLGDRLLLTRYCYVTRSRRYECCILATRAGVIVLVDRCYEPLLLLGDLYNGKSQFCGSVSVRLKDQTIALVMSVAIKDNYDVIPGKAIAEAAWAEKEKDDADKVS